MPGKTANSAGILFYRRTAKGLLLLLLHPGGPYWRGRDKGAWQIPKGIVEAGESSEAAARREVSEELGICVKGALQPLGSLRQAGGKMVTAFAAEQAIDPEAIVSNRFDIEWPPRSGRRQSFPEVDAARWLTLAEADEAILPSQRPLLERLVSLLGEEAKKCG
ncbi:NUDIX domain-containing protein [Sphingopyxis fribergensis]